MVKVEDIFELPKQMLYAPAHEVGVDDGIEVEGGIGREEDMEVFILVVFFVPFIEEDNDFDRYLAVHKPGVKGIDRNRDFSTVIQSSMKELDLMPVMRPFEFNQQCLRSTGW
jgi:hypothetical protein